MKYIVSACLAGFKCRYDGTAKPVDKIVKLYQKGYAIPICPESMSGLKVPRLPSEQYQGKVIAKDGRDVTSEFHLGAEKALQKAIQSQCKIAILKARSPSCGVGSIYDGSFSGKLCAGNGIFTQKLIDSGFHVIDDDHLDTLEI